MTEDKSEDESAADGTVLSPDELDITREKSVVELDEGRYVISADGAAPSVPEEEVTPTKPADIEEVDSAPPTLTEQDVTEWLNDRLSSVDSKYAFHLSGQFEGHLSQKSLYSDDVVTTFEDLLVWYASHVGGDTPVEDVLEILLAESDLGI